MFGNVAENLLEYLTSKATLSLPTPPPVNHVVANVQTHLEDHERDGGVTYSLYFGNQWRQPFYAVGLDNNLTRTTAPETLTAALTIFLQAHSNLLAHPRCCVGIWQTEDVDAVAMAWIDVAVLVYNEARALEFAQAGNQIALYDLRQDGAGEILIGGTGEATLERLNRLDAQDVPEE